LPTCSVLRDGRHDAPEAHSVGFSPQAASAAAVALTAGAALAACGENPTECVTGASCRPSRSALQVGDFVRLNARTDAACDTTTRGFRVGRVAAVSNRAVVVADTGNPAGGFSDAEYASVAAAFDTLVYPVDVRHFGEPTDLDGNGRAIIFYTRAVNELTPANSGFVIGGFFWNRDLFPKTGSGQSACTGSNDGELFYMLAPDPNGTINGNRRTRESVLGGTVAVVAHEFQHLINASRRLYVLKTNNYDEVTWLNEGLSHVAEELSFYQAARLSPSGQPGQSPRSDLTITALRNQPGAIAALNTYNAQNLSRFSRYLRVTADSSPYANNDALATRGATWGFLRYAADRIAQPDSAFLRRLVNSTQTGYENLAAATGAGAALPDWFRDWAVANYAEGLTPTPPRFGYTSWQFRDLLPSLTTNNGGYPLATLPLGEGQPQAAALGGGMAAYFTFRVPAGGTALLRTRAAGGAAPSASVRVTLVRVTEQGGTTITPYGAGAGTDVTVTNGTSGTAQYALVVFNGSVTPADREALTVTGTGLASAPLASAVPAAAGTGVLQAGPTLARLDAAGDALPPVTDAPLHRQLRAIGERELSWRVAGARAAYEARRSGAAERQ
jgi:hypothetical protein